MFATPTPGDSTHGGVKSLCGSTFLRSSISRSELVIHYTELGYSRSKIQAFLTDIRRVNVIIRTQPEGIKLKKTEKVLYKTV